MKYNGLPCPVCGRIMTDDDDIVVCPECATPQHRECWMKTGHCINEDKHSSGYVWAAPEAQPEAEQSESPAEGAGAPQASRYAMSAAVRIRRRLCIAATAAPSLMAGSVTPPSRRTARCAAGRTTATLCTANIAAHRSSPTELIRRIPTFSVRA